MIQNSYMVTVGSVLAGLLLLCLGLVLRDGMTSDLLLIIGVPALLVLFPLFRWRQSVKLGENSLRSGYTFLIILTIISILIASIALWAYNGRGSGWLDFWPKDALGQLCGFFLIVLPVAAVGLTGLYAINNYVTKKRRWR